MGLKEVEFDVNESILKKAEEILKERNINLQDYLRLVLYKTAATGKVLDFSLSNEEKKKIIVAEMKDQLK